MRTAGKLMASLPQLKVIHLVRDPRAIQFSRLMTGSFKIQNAWNMSSNLCNRISRDLETGRELKRLYGGRYATLRYEDLAYEPINMSRVLYQFLGNKLTDSVERFVFNITLAGNKDGCVICSMRKNSREHIYKWRRRAHMDTVKVIDEACHTVYGAGKYLPVSNDTMLKNIHVPLYVTGSRVPIAMP